MPNESVGKTFGVTAAVCIVCSIVVSSTAVFLGPIQEANRIFDIRKNILLAADKIQLGERPTQEQVDTLFENIDTRVVDLKTGDFLDDVDPADVETLKEAKKPESSILLERDQDIATIKRRANRGLMYIPRDAEGNPECYILPVYGKGLWSTMLGFITLDTDLKTIRYFGFYQHGETPGLGGEIDNKDWKKSWRDKIAFDENNKPQIRVIKGTVDPASIYRDREIDGLSGATLTARGVENLVNFWLGDLGYGPMLERLRKEEAGG